MRRATLLLVLAVAGCGGDDSTPAAKPEPEPEPRSASPAAPPDAGTRGGHRPGRVAVPAADPTPPTATIAVGDVVAESPSRPGDRSAPIALRRPWLDATAIARDGEGTGRVRLSVVYERRCGSKTDRVTQYRPPAQIESIRLRPGAQAPTTRRRSARIAFRRGCSVSGEVYAEATNAHGLQAVSRHLRFRYAGRRA